MSNLSINIAALSPSQRIKLESRLKKKRTGGGARPGISRQKKDSNIFPMSFGQQRLWLMDQLDGASSLYNIWDALRFTGELNISALEKALSEIIRRHGVLRTTFELADEQPVQVMAAAKPVTLGIIDLSDSPQAEREAEARRLAREIADAPFELAIGPLFRLRLLRLAADEHVLAFAMHHIVCDGWSLGIFVRELRMLYEAFCANRPSPLTELPVDYADFAVWQRDWLQGERLEAHLSYWKKQLDGSPDVLELPSDRPRQPSQTSRGARHSFVVPRTTAERLHDLSKQETATMFMTLLAAFNALLFRYSGQYDICVGTPIAGRTRAEIEGLIGFFVNNLVMRADLSGDPSFRALLRRVREVVLSAYAHQDLPFEKLVEELRPHRIPGQTPLFQVDFALHNHSIEALKLPGLAVSRLELENETAKFDLMLSVMEAPPGLECSLRYKTDLFDSTTIERMAGHFQQLLESVASDPEQSLSRVPILTQAERHMLLVEVNDTRADYATDVCMHRLFESQAEQTPDSIALIFNEDHLSYRELDRRANQLARYLQERGAGPEVRVGICVERSLEMVIGLLGILKSGAAYVPMDPTYPPGRVAYMLEDSGAAALLTQSSLLEKLQSKISTPAICLDTEWESITIQEDHQPEFTSDSNNLAYIYYTSGSTGRPKGVAVAHYGIVNYIRWGAKAYHAAEGNGAPVHSSIGADLTLANFIPLFIGKPVVLAAELPGVDGLVDLIRTRPQWSMLKITPSHLALLNEQVQPDEMAHCTGVLVIGADNLVADPTLPWRDKAPNVILLNEYGPTETVVGCSLYHITERTPRVGPVPIGKPISNITWYVLDNHFQPVPVGVSGELYIGGIGVARGYWGRPDLSAEKFVPDLFDDSQGARMYRTGDRARYLPDGDIEFLGRLDYQVKIRGFRIELGEIEAVLSAHPDVTKVMVVLVDNGPDDKRLVAYAAAPSGSAGPSELRKYLKELLPDYMVPSVFVVMENLPLTSNGKVDRRALPSPHEVKSARANSFVAPADTVELQLAQMWEDLLKLAPVGVTDNFFDLGGHSLLGVRLMAKIKKEFGRELALSVLFQEPTIKHLAAALREQGASRKWSCLVPIQPRGSQKPFFCVHSLAGDVLSYYDLALHLGPEQPFYGLQAPQLSEVGKGYVSIEELASQYVEVAREIQPKGPYYFAGWSFGCAVAFEMAQQVKRQGESVALLVLLDGMSPLITRQIKDRSDAFLLAGFARDLARSSGVELVLEHDIIRRLGDKEGIAYIIDELNRADIIDQEIEPEWMDRLLVGSRTRMEALRRYDARVYNGKITLFRSLEVELEGAKAWLETGIDVCDELRGWDKLSSEPVEVHRVPGYHATMLLNPHVQVLAKQITNCIRKAENNHNPIAHQ